jgi:hypothetical protein
MIFLSEMLVQKGGICPICGKYFRPNGVGPSDIPELTTVLDNLPSSILLRYGSNFHDWAYHLGPAWGTREDADFLMYAKNEAIITEKGNWWNRWLYRIANKRNYMAVREFGWKFWNENWCK